LEDLSKTFVRENAKKERKEGCSSKSIIHSPFFLSLEYNGNRSSLALTSPFLFWEGNEFQI
jgi:hypothetical protein